MLTLKNRLGFALPLAILVIAILTAALAAGLAATTSDSQIGTSRQGQNRAFAIAQAGLEQFIARRSQLCAQAGAKCVADPALEKIVGGVIMTDTEKVRVKVPGGWADVMAIRIRDSATVGGTLRPSLFYIRSRGVDARRARFGTVVDTAERTVGVYARYNVNVLNVVAAIMSLSGVQKVGSSGIISGADACGKKDTIAGITTPKGEYSTSGNFTPTGDPPVDTFSTQGQLQNTLSINWGSVKGGAIPADFTVPPDGFPSQAWFAADTNRWPIIHVTQDGYSLPNPGRGLIIADGDFTISGSNMWSGVILIGGKLTSNGNNVMSGTTISGLNTTLGQSVDNAQVQTDSSSSLNGNKAYLYNSCSIDAALQGIRGYRPIMNTWMDNVASW